MTQLAFVLCNQAKTSPLASSLTDAVLEQIAAAVMQQAAKDVCPIWGGSVGVRLGAADGSDVKATEIGCFIQDDLSVPGAAAYHATLPNGAPVAYFALSDSTSLISGAGALSVDISHEILETLGDPGANRWADMASGGSEKALELCDQVQNLSYNVGSVAVSDFLLPEAFDPGSAGPFDFLHSAPSGDDFSNGYMITRVVDQQAQDQTASRIIRVLGNVPATQKRRHPTSRLLRRFVRGSLPQLFRG